MDFGEKIKQMRTLLNLTQEELAKVCVNKAKFIYETKEQLIKELNESEEIDLFNDIEMPLSIVLADMELTGIKVDVPYLEGIEKELKEKMDSLEQEIYQKAGNTFNIMSPSQLSKILFDLTVIPLQVKVKYSPTLAFTITNNSLRFGGNKILDNKETSLVILTSSPT